MTTEEKYSKNVDSDDDNASRAAAAADLIFRLLRVVAPPESPW